MNSLKDEIYYKKRKALKSTLSFLQAIKNILEKDTAIKIANKAAANYMISIYEDVFDRTKPGTQERFDAFRKFYETHPKSSPYCEIIESTSNILKVAFHRCPFAEILKDEDLFEFAESSCLSDIAFTNKLLPEVIFSRESSIVKGDSKCIMKWEKPVGT